MTSRMIGIQAATHYLESKRIARIRRRDRREELKDAIGSSLAFLAVGFGPVILLSLVFYFNR